MTPHRHDLRIEPLGDKHNRLSFFSGVEVLDRYLHVLASQDAKRKVAAPYVLVDSSETLVGYYTLAAYLILLTELPLSVQKRFPKYPRVPVTLLGRLAVSRDHQGRKIGRFLLRDALFRSWKSSSEVASAAVVGDAIDDQACAFYRHHEFIPLEGHDDKLFLPTTTIEKAFR